MMPIIQMHDELQYSMYANNLSLHIGSTIPRFQSIMYEFIMEEIKPLKRGKELIALSRDHHDGLMLCWKINTGIRKEISTDRIGAYLLFFFENDLKSHFDLEERYIFPLLAPDNAYRKEAESHHSILHEEIRKFRSGMQFPISSLQYFVEMLTRHIRFEERVLFTIIETETDQTALEQAGEKINHSTHSCPQWDDEFWLN